MKMHKIFAIAALLFAASSSQAGEINEYGADEQGRTYHDQSIQNPPGREWQQQSVPFYLNTAQMPIPLELAEYAVQYALWIWSQRTGRDFYYAGITDVWDAVDSVVINFRTPEQLSPAGQVIASYYTATGYRRHATILLRTDVYDWDDVNCWKQALVHEVGHANGITTHSNNQHDVMYTYLPDPIVPFQDCRYSLSAADVEMTQYDGGDRCFVELTPDMDLFVPEIGGQQASLVYDGSGWDLGIYSASAGGPCNTVTVDSSGDIYMSDVRSMDMSLSDVELESLGNNRWTLRFAQ